ncbi:hypothetical protein F4679DRAFT_565560, partial [Xylaria curta]
MYTLSRFFNLFIVFGMSVRLYGNGIIKIKNTYTNVICEAENLLFRVFCTGVCAAGYYLFIHFSCSIRSSDGIRIL